MYHTSIGRTHLDVMGLETSYFDGVSVQFVAIRHRIKDIDEDFYKNNSLQAGGTVDNPDWMVQYDADETVSSFEPIYCRVITHEIGDSQKNASLSKVIVEAIPLCFDGLDYAGYDYFSTGDDYPKLQVSLRNEGFSNMFVPAQPDYLQKRVDLVAVNMQARESRAGSNPWRSVLQTPAATTDYIPGVQENRTYTLDPSDVQNIHESFSLLAPLHSKFRRCRLKYVCKFTAILRAFTIVYNEYGRRFG